MQDSEKNEGIQKKTRGSTFPDQAVFQKVFIIKFSAKKIVGKMNIGSESRYPWKHEFSAKLGSLYDYLDQFF